MKEICFVNEVQKYIQLPVISADRSTPISLSTKHKSDKVVLTFNNDKNAWPPMYPILFCRSDRFHSFLFSFKPYHSGKFKKQQKLIIDTRKIIKKFKKSTNCKLIQSNLKMFQFDTKIDLI